MIDYKKALKVNDSQFGTLKASLLKDICDRLTQITEFRRERVGERRKVIGGETLKIWKIDTNHGFKFQKYYILSLFWNYDFKILCHEMLIEEFELLYYAN